MRSRHLLAFYTLALLLAMGAMGLIVALDAMDMMGLLSAYLQSTGQYPNVVSIGRFALPEHPAALAVFLFAGAPTLAALLVTLASPSLSLRRLLARLLPVGPDENCIHAGATYLWLFIAYAAGIAVYLALTGWFGVEGAVSGTLDKLGGGAATIVLWLAIAPFLDEGGLLEELGWRGFAQHGLQSILASPLRAALLLGLAWWAWHLPREIPQLLAGADIGRFAGLQALFLMLCIAETVVCVVAVNLCGGSVLPAILVHGGSNVWSKALGSPVYEIMGGLDLRMLAMVVAALFVLWRFGPQLGRT